MRYASVSAVLLFAACYLLCGVFCPTVAAASTIELQQDSYRHLKKRIGLVLFQNKTEFQDARLASFVDEALTGALTKMCEDVSVEQNGHPDFLEVRNHPPRRVSGNIDNMTIARIGRASGLNAIVTGTITEIRNFQEELGYLWFKEMIFFVEVHLQCSVFDTETGAKLYDQFISEKMDVPLELYQQIQAQNYAAAWPEIQGRMEVMISRLGEEICEKIDHELFKTFASTIEGEGRRVVLTSGGNAGIKSGDLFQVHDSSQVIRGKEDYHYFLTGRKTGILRIESIQEDLSVGSIVQGGISGNDACLKPIVEEPFYKPWFE